MRKVAYRTSNNKNEKHVNKNEILLKAVKNKDSDEIHKMIKGGADPEYEDNNGVICCGRCHANTLPIFPKVGAYWLGGLKFIAIFSMTFPNGG